MSIDMIELPLSEDSFVQIFYNLSAKPEFQRATTLNTAFFDKLIDLLVFPSNEHWCYQVLATLRNILAGPYNITVCSALLELDAVYVIQGVILDCTDDYILLVAAKILAMLKNISSQLIKLDTMVQEQSDQEAIQKVLTIVGNRLTDEEYATLWHLY
jgi:hypothetical protein